MNIKQSAKEFLSLLSPFWCIFTLSAMNLFIMHYYILCTASMDDETNFTRFFDNILGIAIDLSFVFSLAYFITLKRQKATAIILFTCTFLWSLSNIIYSRFFHHYISFSAIEQGDNLFNAFMFDCLINGLRWTDLIYIIIFLLFLYLVKRNIFNTKRPLCAILSILFIFLIMDLVGYVIYCSLRPEHRYIRFLTDRIEARHFSNNIQLCNPNVASFRRGSIRALTTEIYINHKGILKLSQEQSFEIKNWIEHQKELHKSCNKLPKPQNIIFIIIESYMSFVGDIKIDGKEVTPFLNSLRRDSCTFYNGQLHKNVTLGESSDGQFIYMTGLLPLRSVVTISQARKNPLPPSLPQQIGYPSRMIIPTVETMWRQDEMCRQYGFDRLYTSKDYTNEYNSVLTDEQVFQLAMKIDRTSKEPFFSVILTMSMHQPYTDIIDPTFPIKGMNIRKDLASYLNKCHYTDKQLEKYFKHLKESGLLNNSLIVITADHPVLSTDFGGVSDTIPLYLIHSQGWSSNIWKGSCNQIDVYTTLVDLLCKDSCWFGLGKSLLLPKYESTLSNRLWDMSEWIIMGDYFQSKNNQCFPDKME